VLTGFKFIAEQIKQFEETKEHTFMFGFEESYGYLLQPFVRDKDAIQALVFVSEMAAFYKEKGDSCFDALQELYHEYGHFKEKTISIKMEGIEGAQKIKDLMARLREETPERFGKIKVGVAEDYLEGTWQDLEEGTSGEINLPQADVLKYKLVDRSWIAARPSGTEPKIKFYIAAFDGSGVEVERKVEAFEQAINELIEE
jgi:phosphoglucomutase